MPSQGTITATINPDSILPVTLLTTEEIFGGHLEQLLDEYAKVDDVFVPDFGGVLVEKVAGNETNSISSQVDVGREVYHLEPAVGAFDQLSDLPSGPYILHGPNVYQAWRLYEDIYEAFTFGVIPENVTQVDQYVVRSSHELHARADDPIGSEPSMHCLRTVSLSRYPSPLACTSQIRRLRSRYLAYGSPSVMG
jgi:hypothetical protein